MKYVLKTGNPKESAGKDRTSCSLRKKALKNKPHLVKIDLLVTNGLNIRQFVTYFNPTLLTFFLLLVRQLVYY